MLTSKYQHTIKNAIVVKGVGVHSGEKATVKILPATESSGITFVRTDIKAIDNIIQAKWSNVSDTKLCTAISNKDGVRVSTVEHIMSAFAVLGVDNATVEIDGPELPIMDGSSLEFIKKINQVGLAKQKSRRKAILIKKTVCFVEDEKEVRLLPSKQQLYSFEIEFDSKAIGFQAFDYLLDDGSYADEIAPARTFGHLREVEYLRSLGLAKGGSLENAIVVDDEKVLNPEGLRYSNEFVRHKILDAIGDVYMAGFQVIGSYHGFKSSHAMNNQLLKALFADPDAYEIVDFIPSENTSIVRKDFSMAYAEALAVA